MKSFLFFLLLNISVFGQNGTIFIDSSKIVQVEKAIQRAERTNLYLSSVGMLCLASGLYTESSGLLLVSIPIFLTSSLTGTTLAYFEMDKDAEGWNRIWSRGLIMSSTYFASFFLSAGTAVLLDREEKYRLDYGFGYIFIGILGSTIVSSYVSTIINQNDNDYLRNLIYRDTQKIEIGFSPSYSPKIKSFGLDLQVKF